MVSLYAVGWLPFHLSVLFLPRDATADTLSVGVAENVGNGWQHRCYLGDNV